MVSAIGHAAAPAVEQIDVDDGRVSSSGLLTWDTTELHDHAQGLRIVREGMLSTSKVTWRVDRGSGVW
jgi:hypothetical protein